jgi:hypothetical protein
LGFSLRIARALSVLLRRSIRVFMHHFPCLSQHTFWPFLYISLKVGVFAFLQKKKKNCGHTRKIWKSPRGSSNYSLSNHATYGQTKTSMMVSLREKYFR